MLLTYCYSCLRVKPEWDGSHDVRHVSVCVPYDYMFSYHGQLITSQTPSLVGAIDSPLRLISAV